MRVKPPWVFAILALFYTGAGFLPGRILVPLDLVKEFGAWKDNPNRRQAVSNGLLSDVVLSFVPWDVQARRMLGSGRIPWINPLSGEGGPLFANPTAALLSPFTWPRLLFGLKGWCLSVFARLFFAGLGAWWLAREMGAYGWAPVVSGVVYMASGFSIVWGMHPQSNVIAVLPALAAAFLRLLRGVTPGRILAVAALAGAAMAGGHQQILAIGVAGVGVFLAWEVFARRRTSPGVWSGSRWGLVAATLGFCLLAVQVVPFLRLLSQSYVIGLRSSASPAVFRLWSVAGLVLPGILGGPLAGELDLARVLPASGSFLTRSEGFLGFVVLLALLATFGSLPSAFRRGLVLSAIAAAFACCPPLLTSLWRHVPFFKVMGEHYCFFLVALFGSAAAGPAIVMLSHRPRGRTRAVAGVLIGFGSLLVIAGLTPSVPPGEAVLRRAARSGIVSLHARGVLRNPEGVYFSRLEDYLREGKTTAARRLAVPGLFWIVAGLGLVVSRRRAVLVGLAAIGELLAFGAGYFPAPRERDLPGAPLVARDMARADPERRFLLASFDGIYPPNLSTFDDLRDIRRNDELESRQWAEAQRANGYRRDALAFAEPLAPDQVARLAGLGVRYYFSRSSVAGARLIGGKAPPAVGLYGVAGALPRPMPDNVPPEGFLSGLAISIVALLGVVVLAWRARRQGSS